MNIIIAWLSLPPVAVAQLESRPLQPVRAKRVIIIVVIAAAGLLVAAALFQPAYTGPGIQGNLIRLEVAKARWWDDHKGGVEWPTKKDLLPYLTNGAPWIHPRHGEIYIINKTGAPVYAYDERTERLSCVTSNDLVAVKYYLEQTK